jgi:hypothetical protein
MSPFRPFLYILFWGFTFPLQAQIFQSVHRFGEQISDLAALAIDSANNLYLAGDFYGGKDFDAGPGQWRIPQVGMTEIALFIASTTSKGNIRWVKALRGSKDYFNATITSIHVDPEGNLIVAGQFRDYIDMDPGEGTYFLETGSEYSSAAFILKLSGLGEFLWARKIPGFSRNSFPVCLDAQGSIFGVSGYKAGEDIDPRPEVVFSPSCKESGQYLFQLSPNGDFLWANRVLDRGWGFVRNLACNTDGQLYLSGDFSSFLFNFGSDTDPKTLQGGKTENTFVMKTGPTGDLLWLKAFAGTADCRPSFLGTDRAGNVVVGGLFYRGTIDFDPGPAMEKRIGNHASNRFFCKLDADGEFQWVRQTQSSSWSDFYEFRNHCLTADGRLFGLIRFSNSRLYQEQTDGKLTLVTGEVGSGIYFLQLLPDGTPVQGNVLESLLAVRGAQLRPSDGHMVTFGTYYTNKTDFDPGPDSVFLPSKSWDTFVLEMKLDTSLSPLKTTQEIPLLVYPNPADDFLTIELSDYQDATLEVFNSLGQLVMEKKLNAPLYRLERKVMAFGNYLVRVRNSKGQTTKRVVFRPTPYPW